MEKILVALDGSPHSSKTLKAATDQALKENSELIILYTCSDRIPPENQLNYAASKHGEDFRRAVAGEKLPEFAVTDRDGEQAISEFMTAREILCRSWGDDVLERARKDAESAGVAHVKTRISKGDVVRSIIEAARAESADLIVVGQRKAASLLERIFGTTAKKVARSAPCAAMLVE